MKKIIAVLFALFVLTGCGKSDEEKRDDRAYDMIVSMYMGQDLNKVKTYDKAEVIKDVREYCDNLPKHEYRSDAANATKFVDNDLSYELALTYGVEIVCGEAWSKAKKMN